MELDGKRMQFKCTVNAYNDLTTYRESVALMQVQIFDWRWVLMTAITPFSAIGTIDVSFPLTS